MKNSRLTEEIMKKVVSFEKRRTGFSLAKMLALFLPLFILLALILTIVINKLSEFNTFELFSLLGEDKEIINEFWQEVTQTFWAELPLIEIASGVITFLAVICLFWMLRKSLKRIKNRIQGLAKYKKDL